MANIKVHLLNFHSILSSHIEIILENTSTQPHTLYNINQWAQPQDQWIVERRWTLEREQANSIYSFDIEADSEQIIAQWKNYWLKAGGLSARVLGNNCAVAAQWFLKEFANIDNPSLSNVSVNYLSLGLMWPSFIPCPVTLPGRIMSNAKFHMEARNNPELFNQYSRLFLYISLTLSLLTFSASVFALAMTTAILVQGLAILILTASTYGFFKSYNTLSAKNISERWNKPAEVPPVELEANDNFALIGLRT